MSKHRIVIWVSPAGNDGWTGRLPDADAQGKDGPFQTLARARGEVRTLKKTQAACDVVVELRGGTYTFSETFILDQRDSFERGSLTFRAHQDETVVFSGAVPVSDWKKAEVLPDGMASDLRGKIWQAPIPSGVDDFKVMFRNSKKLRRACGEGFNPLVQETSGPQYEMMLNHAYEMSHFVYPQGTLRNWKNLQDIEVIARPSYPGVMNILGLTAVDEASSTAATHVLGTYPLNPVKNRISMWIENAPESLTEPGEWIVDTLTRTIYYYPEDGADPGDSVTVPTTQVLVKVEGEMDVDGPVDRPVKGINFHGITFTQGDRGTWQPGDTGIQHDWEMLDADDALLRFRGAENCQVRGCTFRQSGDSAIRFDLYAQGNLVKDCVIHDIGGAGILFIGYGPGTKDVNKCNTICDNHICRVGQIYWHSHGIVLWQSGHNRVRNNLIHDVPRKAVCMSGVRVWFFEKKLKNLRECAKSIRWHEIGEACAWEEILPFLHTRFNIVEHNEAYHCLQKLGDGGVMNISGAGLGNVIRRNYVHDIRTKEWTDGVLRTDDFQCGSLIEENIVFNSDASALVMKGENTALNNYFINNGCMENAVVRITEGNKASVFSRNLIIKSAAKTPGRAGHPDRYNWDNMIYAPMAPPETQGNVIPTAENLRGCTLDYNILFSESAGPDGSPELKDYFAAYHESHSVLSDPKLADWESACFEPLEGSPVYRLGIRPLSTECVGLLSPVRTDVSDNE